MGGPSGRRRGRHRERAGRRHHLAGAGPLPDRPGRHGERGGGARTGAGRRCGPSGTCGSGARRCSHRSPTGAAAGGARSPRPGSTTTPGRCTASIPSTSPSRGTRWPSTTSWRRCALRLRAGAPVVRALAGRASANVVATLRGTSNPRAAVRRRQPFRFSEGRAGLRRQHLGDHGPAGGGPGDGAPAPGGDDPLRVVHLRRVGAARKQGVRARGHRRPGTAWWARSTTTCRLGQRRPAGQHRSATPTPVSGTFSTRRRSSSPI